MPKEQLCWTCQRACGGVNGCEWSNKLSPVQGWTAEIITRKNGEQGYLIAKCPKYINDGIKEKPKKKLHRVISEKTQKTIVELRNLNYTYKKIAEITKVSPPTIRKIIQENNCL